MWMMYCLPSKIVVYSNVMEIFDFNQIGNRLFNQHGLHLPMAGKKLAKLLIKAAGREGVNPSTLSTWVTAYTPMDAPAERMVFCETYTNAVKRIYVVNADLAFNFYLNNCIFLE